MWALMVSWGRVGRVECVVSVCQGTRNLSMLSVSSSIYEKISRSNDPRDQIQNLRSYYCKMAVKNTHFSNKNEKVLWPME